MYCFLQAEECTNQRHAHAGVERVYRQERFERIKGDKGDGFQRTGQPDSRCAPSVSNGVADVLQQGLELMFLRGNGVRQLQHRNKNGTADQADDREGPSPGSMDGQQPARQRRTNDVTPAARHLEPADVFGQTERGQCRGDPDPRAIARRYKPASLAHRSLSPSRVPGGSDKQFARFVADEVVEKGHEGEETGCRSKSQIRLPLRSDKMPKKGFSTSPVIVDTETMAPRKAPDAPSESAKNGQERRLAHLIAGPGQEVRQHDVEEGFATAHFFHFTTEAQRYGEKLLVMNLSGSSASMFYGAGRGDPMGRPFWTDYASGDLPNRRTIAHNWELVSYVSQILTCEWRWLILVPGKHGHPTPP